MQSQEKMEEKQLTTNNVSQWKNKKIKKDNNEKEIMGQERRGKEPICKAAQAGTACLLRA